MSKVMAKLIPARRTEYEHERDLDHILAGEDLVDDRTLGDDAFPGIRAAPIGSRRHLMKR
jgi:hypothetical protein